jgi:predicted NBD/HSP70 family sugar kinase
MEDRAISGEGMPATHNRLRLSGTNLKRVADHNQRITLHAIRVHGPLTRIELASITGLTPPAIANITRRLLVDGFISEAGRRRGSRGQPPTDLVINPDACYAIGINVDRDHVTTVLMNFVGETVSRRSSELAFALPKQVAAFCRSSIREMLAETNIDLGTIVGIGVAKPDDLGVIDLPGRPAGYSEWETIDWETLFGDPIRLPVFVENDSAAAAMGEQQLGLGQQYPSFFYILVSWGLGGGLVVDGNYFRGANGRSGEIGFLLGGDGKDSGTPIQKLVSLSSLSQYLKPLGFELSDIGQDDAQIVAAVQIWLDRATDALLEPITAINCLINPSAILIGGRLPKNFVETLTRKITIRLSERAYHLPAIAPVRCASLAEDAPAVGAATLPFAHFLLPTSASLWRPTKVPETEAA